MTEFKEKISDAQPGDIIPLQKEPAKPKRIYLHAFQGDRTDEFTQKFDMILEANEKGGDSPSEALCLVYTGHVGVSFDSPSNTIYGGN